VGALSDLRTHGIVRSFLYSNYLLFPVNTNIKIPSSHAATLQYLFLNNLFPSFVGAGSTRTQIDNTQGIALIRIPAEVALSAIARALKNDTLLDGKEKGLGEYLAQPNLFQDYR
jgi:hypothetical protein